MSRTNKHTARKGRLDNEKRQFIVLGLMIAALLIFFFSLAG